jgi:hypothetical protein
MSSNLHRAVTGNGKDLDTLIVERPVVFGLLPATLLKGVHHRVVPGDACGVVEELEIRAEAAAELGDVASVVGIEELPVSSQYLLA